MGLHAIAFPWPRQGHVIPMLRFSELLSVQGCDVTFVHSELNLKRVKQQGEAAAADCGSSKVDEGKIGFLGISDGLPDGHPRDMESLLLSCTPGRMEVGLASGFENLVGSLLSHNRRDEVGTTFIVSDFFMVFTQDVANKFGIPRIAVFPQSAASFACHLAVAQGFRPLPGDTHLTCLQGVLPSTTKPSDMISFLQCYDPNDPIFSSSMHCFERLSEPTCIVLNTFDELEHAAIEYLHKTGHKRARLYCGGPLLPLNFLKDGYESRTPANGSLRKEDNQCLNWLDSQAVSSVLFVSFGSLARLTTQQVEEFALGLEASTVPFLWVLRSDLIKDGGLPDGFTERVKERACFVTWAPQMKVLSHPSVGGFLTHCGWNSTTEAVAGGVPLLGWAYFADQMLHCKCIADSWGVGLSLFDSRGHEELVTRNQVEKKVRALILETPPSIKRNCARLKEAASKAAESRNASLVTPLLDALKQMSPSMTM